MNARIFARVHPSDCPMVRSGNEPDDSNVAMDLGGTVMILSAAEARQLAIDLFRAASPAAGAPMAPDRAEKHLQVQA